MKISHTSEKKIVNLREMSEKTAGADE